MLNGEVGQGLETMSPSATRNVIRLMNDGWIARDYKGRPLNMEQGTMSKVLESVGFSNSDRVRLFRESQLQDRSNEVANAQRRRFHKNLAEQTEKQDFQSVRQALIERQDTSPGYDAAQGARIVAQQTIERLFPVDPYREVGVRENAVARGESLRKSGLKPQINELDRYKAYTSLLGQLGFPVKPSAAEFQRRYMIDYWMSQGLTRSEALMRIDGQLPDQLQE